MTFNLSKYEQGVSWKICESFASIIQEPVLENEIQFLSHQQQMCSDT